VLTITLGLRVTGEEVTLKYGDALFMNSLFNGSEITINLVLAKLRDPDVNKDENVEDFCRLLQTVYNTCTWNILFSVFHNY